MKKVFIYIIEFYQKYISSNTQPRCNFYPTCSNYAKEALEVHGIIYGSILSIWRILRCHPFQKMQVDLVPEKRRKKHEKH